MWLALVVGHVVGPAVGHVVMPVTWSVVSTALLISHAEIMISHLEITHLLFCFACVSPPMDRFPHRPTGTMQASCKHHLSTILAPFKVDLCSVLALLIAWRSAGFVAAG